jgi:lipopolysaccharide transport protein LptA
MAFKLPDTAVAFLLLALAAWPAARPAAAADAPAKPACPRIEYRWDNIDGNLRGGKQHITGLEFWSCDARGVETIRVRADDATGPDTDFASGEWRLQCNVVVTIPDGELKGDTAVVVLKNRSIASAAVSGMPANFAQHASAATSAIGISNARGEAADFRYDVASGDVSMSGGAFIAYQDTEFRCSLIVYNLGTQKYRGLAARDKGEVCRGQTRTGGAAGTNGQEARPPVPGAGAPTGGTTP